jgi:SAM-dependent methyltransferase
MANPMVSSLDELSVYTVADRLQFTNPALLAALKGIDRSIDAHRAWLEANIQDPDSGFQKFLRGYYAVGSHHHYEESLNRFAMSVFLVESNCPPQGAWLDVGAMGHDAIRVKLVRGDIDCHLYVLEGCIIYLDERGLQYGKHAAPGASTFVQCRKVDIESQPLPVPDESIDLLTGYEVLEHFKSSPRPFFVEANRVLKPGGKLVLTTPNAASAVGLCQILRGLHPAECALYHRDPRRGRIHPLEWTQLQLEEMLAAHQFSADTLASINLRPFEALELAAVRASQAFLRGHTYAKYTEYGMKWLVVATKRANLASEAPYPPSVFE